MEFIKIIELISLFGFVIISGLYLMTDSIAKDNIEIDSQSNNVSTSLGKIQTIMEDDFYDVSSEQYETLVNEEVADEGVFDRIIMGAQTALNQIVGVFRVINVMGTELSLFFNVPKFVVTIFYTLVLSTITLLLIYMGFRFQPR